MHDRYDRTTLPTDTEDAPVLIHSWADRRALRNGMFTIGAWLVALIAVIPLVSVLYMLIVQGGIAVVRPTCSPSCRRRLRAWAAAFGNAILGTLLMVVSRPDQRARSASSAACFLAEFGPESQLGRASRFCRKVLTGLPSILAGVFATPWSSWPWAHYSAIAGGVALVDPDAADRGADGRGSDEDGAAQDAKDAAIGMGCTRTQMIWTMVVRRPRCPAS